MFGRKKKKAPFGTEITPKCSYCRFGGKGENRCALKLSPEDAGKCRKYVYDPLKREPHAAPPLREYHAEDFEL